MVRSRRALARGSSPYAHGKRVIFRTSESSTSARKQFLLKLSLQLMGALIYLGSPVYSVNHYVNSKRKAAGGSFVGRYKYYISMI